MQHLPEIVEPRVTLADSFDPKKVAEAFDLFLNQDMSLECIAVQLGMPFRQVQHFAKREKWLDRKEQLTRTLEQEAEQRYREFLAKSRLPTAQSHLENAKLLEDLIADEIKNLQSMEAGRERSAAIRRLAEALSSTTGVSARAAGITDRPASVGAAQQPQQQRQPLVMIGIRPSIDTGTTIDISDYTKDDDV